MSKRITWDTTAGEPVETHERDEWADEAVAKVLSGEDSWDIRSGNAVVIAIRHADGITVYDAVIVREGLASDE